MKKKIIFAPQKYGAGFEGLDLISGYLTKHIKPDITVLSFLLKENVSLNNLKNLQSVVSYTNQLATVISNIIKNNEMPITIGGDHSISMGTVFGVASEIENLGVIWIDAHGDMNTDETTITGNIHGMPLAVLQGLGNKELINAYKSGLKIPTQNIVIYGVRDLDDKEKELMDSIGIYYVPFIDIKKRGLETTLKESIIYLKEKTNKLHISFDLDVLNPEVIPGVSVPVKDGLLPEEIYWIFDQLFKSFDVSSIDIVEYNPLFDKDNKTLEFINLLFYKIINN
jgi:ornithine decarboxylase